RLNCFNCFRHSLSRSLETAGRCDSFAGRGGRVVMSRQLGMSEMEPPGGVGEMPPAAGGNPGFLHTLFASLPAPPVVLGSCSVYRYANQEFLDFVGRDAGEIIGRSVGEVLGEAVAQSYAPLMDRLLTGERVRREGWLDYGPRGRRYVQETFAPWRDGEG